MEPQPPLNHKAVVTKIGASEINKKNYQWIQVDETIFHPKGGGQLSDQGKINGIDVSYIHKEILDKNRLDQFSILHCFEEKQLLPFRVGDRVNLEVNPQVRSLYSRMHTAGHLLAEVVHMAFSGLEPFQGNHDPENGYVRFKFVGDLEACKEEFLKTIQPELNRWIAHDCAIQITELSSGLRGIQWDRFVMACGGTHVNHLIEIGSVEAFDLSINAKDKNVTVKYRLS